ncbi:MAG: hypothetical protein WDN06_22535 [Asticcacaulis sp.]
MLAVGVKVIVVRLPQVHDPRKQGLISPLIDVARQKGLSAYVGDGANRWAAAMFRIVARLYRLAVEQGRAGERFNAVGEEGIPARDIATVVGAGLGVPVVSLSPAEALEHFGWLGMFVAHDMPASSAMDPPAPGLVPRRPGPDRRPAQDGLSQRFQPLKACPHKHIVYNMAMKERGHESHLAQDGQFPGRDHPQGGDHATGL